MSEFYSEFPGKIRGKKRRRRKPRHAHELSNSNSNSALLGETYKVEYNREKERTKFLSSKEWGKLTKQERKHVSAIKYCLSTKTPLLFDQRFLLYCICIASNYFFCSPPRFTSLPNDRPRYEPCFETKEASAHNL
jgi:hypothetical protein